MRTHDEERSTKDRLDVADLMAGWIHRDLGEWDRLRELFHPEGTIAITWFEGLFSDFVDASARMAASDVRSKHLIASPVISFRGDKAIVETNAMILIENVRLGIGCVSHNRFYDEVEKRDGVWKIVRRQSIYDMGSFTFPRGVYEVNAEIIARYPREYAPLAYLLEVGGFPLCRVQATKGSDLEKAMKAAGQEWLAS